MMGTPGFHAHQKLATSTQRVTASSYQKPGATAGHPLIPRLGSGSGHALALKIFWVRIPCGGANPAALVD